MSNPTKPITTKKQRSSAIADMLFAFEALGAEIVAGAIYDPKLPPYSGD